MTTIKLLAPKALPEEGLTAVAFEAWQNQVISFLEQEIVNFNFTSGPYNTWTARLLAEDGTRIKNLDARDEELIKIEATADEAAEKGRKKNNLKKLRNSQLTKCLQLIANMCQYSEQSDIMNNSTSLSWIWDYLRRHYNIESKGSHFLSVAAINPKPDQNHMVFYKQFRSGFINNLRKKDDSIMYKDGFTLPEDEIISPTFECAIMLWALEKIDPRLPSKVQKDFGFRMEGNITLIELQTPVFQAIPGMLEELDNATEARAVWVENKEDTTTHLAALGNRGGYGRGRGDRRGGSRAWASRVGGRSTSQWGRQNKGQDTNQSWCRICKLAGKSESVVRSHNIGKCYFFTKQDQADLLANLSLIDTDIDTGNDSPYYDDGEEGHDQD